MTLVRISAASMRQEFHGCTPEYIRTRCLGACCRTSGHPSGAVVVVHAAEADVVAQAGGVVLDGFLVPSRGRCVYQAGDGLCEVHATPSKPFGCVASPFVLTSRKHARPHEPVGTLIVRNRYRLLRCYREGGRAIWGDVEGRPPLPAYRAFEGSLVRLFGPLLAAGLVRWFDGGGGDLEAVGMRDEVAGMLRDNSAAHRK